MTEDSKPGSLMFVLPSLVGGGAERNFLHYSKAACAAGYDAHLVLIRATGELTGRIDPGIRVTDLAASRARYAVPSLARLIARERPAAIFSRLWPANAAALTAAALARTGARRIAGQAMALSQDTDRTAARISLGRRLRLAALLRLADVVIAPSEGVREDLAHWLGLPQHRLAAVPNPLDLDAIVRESRAPAPHPWTSRGGPPVILGVGRLNPQKNFAMLIEAFARVRAAREARLIILGEGPLRPRLEAQVRALGLAADVQLPGFVDNPFAYYARAGVFALSSDREAWANVVAEALACGCPVVSTDCPWGPPEILAGGRFGRLVPVGDAAAMAAALMTALDAPPAKDALIARAGEFAVKNCFQKLIAAAGLD